MSLPKPYYDDGNGIVIYLGDCREILPHLEPVDLVLTDPPYGLHPTEKPQELLEHIILANVCDTILDPFMGSGTTLRAAKDLGRKAIGIEISREYCDIAIRRLQQETLPLQCEPVEQERSDAQASMNNVWS